MEPLIVALGINHKTAPVELRELFACNTEGGKLRELEELKNTEGVKELLLLSTCNRSEIYAVVENESVSEKLLENFIKLKAGGYSEKLKGYFFLKRGEEAVKHVISIPAGLSSMVVGETQITSQFKEAVQLAREAGTLGEILTKLTDTALRAAKRIRNETEISKTPLSVSYIAVLLAKSIFGALEGVKVLVVGAGETAELTARYLKRERARIFVTNRTFERAVKLAEEIGGGVVEWGDFKKTLGEFEIAVFSTSAGDYILTKPEVEKLVKRRKTPLVLVDISVPRNVEPSVGEIPNVFLYNIDNLKEIAQRNLKRRSEEAQKGWLVVEEETEKFLKWLKSYGVKNLIAELNRSVETLKDIALQNAGNGREALDLFSKKLLHPIYKVVKENPSVGEELLAELKKLVNREKERVYGRQ